MTIAHDEAGTFFWTRTVADLTLRLEASKLSPSDKTGLHARIVILLEGTQLAFSRFNVERDEDRLRLANSAYKHIENDLPLKKAYPKEYLKADLDNFCSGLEAALCDTIEVEELAGALDRKPPTFLVWPYILEGGGSILFGPPGRGKSYTLLLMAVSLDAGIRDIFNTPKPRKVLVVNLERSAESQRLRLGNVNAALGLPRDRSLFFLNARGKSLSDVSDRIRKAIREHKIEALFLDSISRAGMGDLNENAPVNRITDMLNGLCPSWFALAHTPRGDDTHVYGSVHFDAAADVMCQLVSQLAREKFELGIGLEIVKCNDLLLPDMQVIALRFSQEGLGLEDVRLASKKEFRELASAQGSRSLEDVICDYLAIHYEASGTTIAGGISRPRQKVADVLSQNPRFVGRRAGQEVLYHVLLSEPVTGDTSEVTGDRLNGHGAPNGVAERVTQPVRDVSPPAVASNDRARARIDTGTGDTFVSGEDGGTPPCAYGTGVPSFPEKKTEDDDMPGASVWGGDAPASDDDEVF